MLFLCTFAIAQIPDFTVHTKLENFLNPQDYSGAICFANWDSDSLEDIIWVDNNNTRLKYYKNIGTPTNPSYEDKGYLRDEEGKVLQFYHG